MWPLAADYIVCWLSILFLGCASNTIIQFSLGDKHHSLHFHQSSMGLGCCLDWLIADHRPNMTLVTNLTVTMLTFHSTVQYFHIFTVFSHGGTQRTLHFYLRCRLDWLIAILGRREKQSSCSCCTHHFKYAIQNFWTNIGKQCFNVQRPATVKCWTISHHAIRRAFI